MPPFKEYVKGAPPPVTAPAMIVPSAFPQVEFVVDVACAVGPGVSATFAITVNVQRLASRITTVYVDAVNPV